MRVTNAIYAGGLEFAVCQGWKIKNGVKRRPRRRCGAEEKERIIGLYEGSGLSVSEFCRREGIGLINLQRALYEELFPSSLTSPGRLVEWHAWTGMKCIKKARCFGIAAGRRRR